MILIVYEQNIGSDGDDTDNDNNAEDDCQRLNGWNGFNFYHSELQRYTCFVCIFMWKFNTAIVTM